MTDEQAIGRRRKANLLAKSHKYKSSSRKQRLLDWSIFITNISEDMVNDEHIMIIYRARWQIELLFKLYKSHAKLKILKGEVNLQEFCVNYMVNYVVCLFFMDYRIV